MRWGPSGQRGPVAGGPGKVWDVVGAGNEHSAHVSDLVTGSFKGCVVTSLQRSSNMRRIKLRQAKGVSERQS